jgi:hypothetical protein
MHAARDKPTRVRSAGLPGGGFGPGPCGPGSCEPGPCGPGPAEGGRASSRSILASCSVRRVSCSSARLICSWACASPSSARAMVASWGLISFGSGVEFIGVSLFRPMSSEGARSIIRQVGPAARTCPVLSKEWPYDGENGDRMEEYRITWCGHPGIRRDHCRRRSGAPPRFHITGAHANSCGQGQVTPRKGRAAN